MPRPRSSRLVTRGLALILGAGLLAASVAPVAAAGPEPLVPAPRSTRQTEPSNAGAGRASAPTGRYIVRYGAGVSREARAAVRAAQRVDLAAELPLLDAELVTPRDGGATAATAVAALARRDEIVSVEPEYRRFTSAAPTTEPYYGLLWGLNNTGQTIGGYAGAPDLDMNVPEAWQITTGSPSLVVAVIDDGVDFSHPDLAGSQWINPGESGDGRETNGIDDDANGHIDDVNGWDFCHGDNSLHDVDDDSHGTHVAGTIAARVNSLGITGVAPSVKVMALKFLSDNDASCGTDGLAIEAIAYAVANGARIINASWGGPDYSSALEDAIAAVPSSLVVAASGNDGTNNDVAPQYPAAFDLANVLSVAAIHNEGRISAFSNVGPASVDLAAPGEDIASALPATSTEAAGWAYMSGTSMAAANASGVAALAASARPTLLGNGAALRTHLIGTARALPAAQGLLAYPRLLDARAAVVSRPDIRRLAGADRYETAAAISRAVYPPNTPYVFIAVGTNFPDALAGGALAARAGAPMLLVKGSVIPPATAAELTRLAPYRIFVLGSAGVIPESVTSQLAGYQSGGGVTRISGPDRYATAANVAAWFPANVPVAYVATGRNFPDALSGVPAAELNGGPLLLVTESRISAETQAALNYLQPKKIIILGSAGVVGSGVAAALDAYTTGPVLRQSGPDRYTTASEISKGTFSTSETVFVATGRNFPDALGGGTAAAAFDGPLLLVPGTTVPVPVATEIKRLAPARVFVLGTAPVVSDGVVTTIRGFFP